MSPKYFRLAVTALFFVGSNLYGYSTLRPYAYCQDRESLKALSQDPKTDRVLNGIRVTVEVQGKVRLKNIKYGAFVEAGKIPSTERAAYSQPTSDARKSERTTPRI